MLAHNNSPCVDMQSHLNTLTWLRANISLHLLLITVYLTEKQILQSSLSLISPYRVSNQRSTVLHESTLAITPPMWFQWLEVRGSCSCSWLRWNCSSSLFNFAFGKLYHKIDQQQEIQILLTYHVCVLALNMWHIYSLCKLLIYFLRLLIQNQQHSI